MGELIKLIGHNPVINGKQYVLKLPSDGRASFASLNSIENPLHEVDLAEHCPSTQVFDGPLENAVFVQPRSEPLTAKDIDEQNVPIQLKQGQLNDEHPADT